MGIPIRHALAQDGPEGIGFIQSREQELARVGKSRYCSAARLRSAARIEAGRTRCVSIPAIAAKNSARSSKPSISSRLRPGVSIRIRSLLRCSSSACRQRRGGVEHLAADSQNRRVGLQFVGRGDAIGVQLRSCVRLARADAVLRPPVSPGRVLPARAARPAPRFAPSAPGLPNRRVHFDQAAEFSRTALRSHRRRSSLRNYFIREVRVQFRIGQRGERPRQFRIRADARHARCRSAPAIAPGVPSAASGSTTSCASLSTASGRPPTARPAPTGSARGADPPPRRRPLRRRPDARASETASLGMHQHGVRPHLAPGQADGLLDCIGEK